MAWCSARPSPKWLKQAAKTAGITAQLATHTGCRSVITRLCAEGEEALEDIAKFVGHARSSTTAGYVKRLGRRPRSVADRAAKPLDGSPGTTRATPPLKGMRHRLATQ